MSAPAEAHTNPNKLHSPQLSSLFASGSHRSHFGVQSVVVAVLDAGTVVVSAVPDIVSAQPFVAAVAVVVVRYF